MIDLPPEVPVVTVYPVFVEDGDGGQLDSIWSRRDLADARAARLNEVRPTPGAEVDECRLDDPWLMPVNATPLADIVALRDRAREHSDPI